MIARPILLGVGAAILVAPAPARAQADPVREDLTAGMGAWLASLEPQQLEEALYRFDDEERFDLRLAPIQLEGLRIDQMDPTQWSTLHAVLGRVLSPEGLQKTDTIRSLEREVAEMEGGPVGWVMRGRRDPERYFLALFGEPSTAESWGMRFDGHHLSLNWTAVADAPVSVTPLFLGGQPREVPAPLERSGLRVLAAEEDRALELVASLSDAQREKAALEWRSGGFFSRPMMIGEPPDLELGTALGIARPELAPEQQAKLDTLVEVYLANFTAAIASRHRAQIAAQADQLRFAYGAGHRGVPAAGDPFYYRIQGETLLIEFDNTGDDADHVHVVWRELDGDFGRDVLREHLRTHHAP